MSIPITASLLYNLVQCPHRVTKDLFADPLSKDPVSPFVQLLWDQGNFYEREVISKLATPFIDLSKYRSHEKEKLTYEAMGRGEKLIYSGRIHAGDLLGEPDLLRREDLGYVPVDIKSGSGEEGEDDGKLKKHYGVQLALYVDILDRLKFSGGRQGYIWDVHGDEVEYDLNASLGPRTPDTMWDIYSQCLAEARAILKKGQ